MAKEELIELEGRVTEILLPNIRIVPSNQPH